MNYNRLRKTYLRTGLIYIITIAMIIILLISLSVAQQVSQQVSRIFPTDDTYVDRTAPTTNLGNFPNLFTGNPAGSEEYQIFIQFDDLSELPIHNELVHAELCLFKLSGTDIPEAARVDGLGDWDELNLTWDNGSDLINCCDYPGFNNGDYDCWDITELVRAWLDGGSGISNEGVAIILLTTNTVSYKSKESANPPYLEFTPMIGITKENTLLPDRIVLQQNYPNPFNPSTKISFDLPSSEDVKLVIYDIGGKEVERVVDERLQPGSYSVTWDAHSYPSGVYFYKLHVGDYVEVKKMILLK